MADLKVTELTANTTPALADLLPMVDDPSGTPLTQKITIETLAGLFSQNSMSRQAIINGNFDVWQRGTTYTGIATGSFLADRFALSHSADSGAFPTHINRRTAITAGEIPNSFYSYELNVNGAGTSLGNGSYYWLRQKIEQGVRNLCGDGKKVTLSFWAKSDIANKRFGVHIRQDYGTGGSPSTAEVINGTNWTLTSTWTKYTYTFTTNTLTAKTFGTDNNDVIDLQFMYQWGSTYQARADSSTVETFVGSGSIFIAQVQLCAGDVALPFQPKSFAQELLDCMRYYEKSYDYAQAPGTDTTLGVLGFHARSTLWGYQITFGYKVRKRVATTPVTYSKTGASGKFRDMNVGADVNSGIQYPSETSFEVYGTGASLTVNNEYSFHYTADAEL